MLDRSDLPSARFATCVFTFTTFSFGVFLRSSGFLIPPDDLTSVTFFSLGAFFSFGIFIASGIFLTTSIGFTTSTGFTSIGFAVGLLDF